MADKAFDLCECIWSHQFAVQRLLNILRESQSYCSDTECFNLSRLQDPRDDQSSTDFLTVCLIVAFGFIMYALRPNSLRQIRSNNAKDRDNGPNSNDDPPVPPSTAH
ncbi:small integral membrane protein 14 [Calliopsis andreniformis]|uniref:small integral membrane protein 14 n=1 Tax=Calliopsis andreniformis TaxID=337506 RepID=UPI003FCD8F0B